MLVIQAIIFSCISTAFLYIPSMNAAYWWLSDISAQLALVVYIVMFLAFIKLRYTDHAKPSVYRVPGGKCGMWLVAGSGLLSSLFGFILGFVSPSQVPSAAKALSLELLIVLIAIIIVIPFCLGKKHR
jgi:amino acid transporter